MPRKPRLAEDAAGSQIYVGPSIPGVAAHGMLFTELPPPLLDCMESCNAVKSFVVQVKDYAYTKSVSERKGSFLYEQRQEVLRWLNGGKKE